MIHFFPNVTLCICKVLDLFDFSGNKLNKNPGSYLVSRNVNFIKTVGKKIWVKNV